MVEDAEVEEEAAVGELCDASFLIIFDINLRHASHEIMPNLRVF